MSRRIVIFVLLSALLVAVAGAAVPVKKLVPLEPPVWIPPEGFPPVGYPVPPGSGNLSPGPRSRYFMPLDLGIYLSLHSGIPALLLDQKWNQPFGFKDLAVKTGVAYAQGKDFYGVERKNALIYLDGVYLLPLIDGEYAKPYLGGGLNYLFLTTGRRAGEVGGEVYVGMETRVQAMDKHFIEIGYSAIRTGFSNSYKGLYLALGYRRKI